MPHLLQSVRAYAAHHTLWRSETRLIVALSGGSDSVALLWILHELQSDGRVQLDAAAHFNHGIRGAEADADEQFARELCARLQIPCSIGRADVPALARRRRQSIEVAARFARREFLLSVLTARGADRIATAHTRDDQAETVLLRLLRGSGLKGAGAIAPRRGRLVRPLLDCSRDELRRFLATRRQPWREDSTNADIALPRNRLRHDVLPRLEEHFNPQARAALARFADLARDDEEWLSRQAAALTVQMVRLDNDTVRVDRPLFARLPPALARRVARNALEAAGLTQPRLQDIEALTEIAAARRRAVEVPGLRMEPSGRFVVLIIKGSRRTSSPPRQASGPRRLANSPAFSFQLAVPGLVAWQPGGWVLSASGPISVTEGGGRFRLTRGSRIPVDADRIQAPVDADRIQAIVDADRIQVIVDADRIGPELVVRGRKPGDWLRPVGAGGRKKVQDVLVDRKVRAETREHVPIVTGADGRIIWVAGHALDVGFRPSSDTNAVVILELRRLGEASASSGV